jgi:hypothetical protein
MQEKHLRSLMVLLTLVVFFPTWIALMALYHYGLRELEARLQIELSLWLKNVGSFILLGLVLMVVTRRASSWLDKKYPHAKARSAHWQDAG